jgi:hypothetical protein
MNRKALLCGIAAALLSVSACSSPSSAPKATTAPVTSNANTKPAAPPANTSTSDAGASQQAKQDFTLVNKTGVEINALFISPHDVDDWEEDILGRDTLPNAQSVDVTFKREEKAAMWDLRIEDDKDGSVEWENLNLLKISKVTLYIKDGKAIAETE